jgi:spore germination protein GerM
MEDRKGIHTNKVQGFQGIRRLPIGIVVTLATVVLASGGSAAWFTWRALNPVAPPVAEFPTIEQPNTEVPTTPTTPDTVVETPTAPQPSQETPTAAPTAEASGEIFWVRDVDGRLALSPEAVKLPGNTPEEQIQSAFQALLTEPGNPTEDAVTTIPDDTEVLEVNVESNGVHVDLSEAFTLGGGSTSMVGRLGQVVYTASSLDPDAPVWISVEGEPLTVLGGEGIEVSQPMTREDVSAAFDL